MEMREGTSMADECHAGIRRTVSERIAPRGEVEIVHSRGGVVLDRRVEQNLVVTAGKVQAAKYWIGTGGAAMTWIAVGTGTSDPAAGNTTLQAEITDSGLARKQDTAPTNSSNEASITVLWNVTGTKAVTESGIFNASSSGQMGARVTFAALNMSSGDTLQLTWKFTFG